MTPAAIYLKEKSSSLYARCVAAELFTKAANQFKVVKIKVTSLRKIRFPIEMSMLNT